MSAGTRSRAMTADAPASSAIRAYEMVRSCPVFIDVIFEDRSYIEHKREIKMKSSPAQH
jgi:hypothetical protein